MQVSVLRNCARVAAWKAGEVLFSACRYCDPCVWEMTRISPVMTLSLSPDPLQTCSAIDQVPGEVTSPAISGQQHKMDHLWPSDSIHMLPVLDWYCYWLHHYLLLYSTPAWSQSERTEQMKPTADIAFLAAANLATWVQTAMVINSSKLGTQTNRGESGCNPLNIWGHEILNTNYSPTKLQSSDAVQCTGSKNKSNLQKNCLSSYN